MENKGNWAVISLESVAAEKAQCFEAEDLPPLCRICCPCTETPENDTSGLSLVVLEWLWDWDMQFPLISARQEHLNLWDNFTWKNEHIAFPGD